MKRAEFIRWVNYQKTLMAVYWLSEPDGLLCYATVAELAAETGLSTSTIRRHLALLETRDVAFETINPHRGRLKPRVFYDHPGFRDFIRQDLDYWGPLSLQAGLNRSREAARHAETDRECASRTSK